ncbi:GNAT family N-acetyltransferase [Affinirhizobium pseudoryzae]|uniref:GNAT family N-acetyltransferase n=1 Tax=Allorhizobium pseudoryzae TaxID=379684 RepID=UPI0013EA4A5E|nr:GNAT family N-acetyltransferase [Allorhizobium pseudoryzae]
MDAELVLRRLQPGDKLSGFSLGHANFTPLKMFLKKDAQAYETNNLARTYALFEPEKNVIKAYVTITCGEVALKDGVEHDGKVNYRFPHYPAVKIARLAVTEQLKGRGVGKMLVEFSLGVAKELICPHVGCRFAVVDSKAESVDFYRRCGFTFLDTPENKSRPNPVMFIDLSKI